MPTIDDVNTWVGQDARGPDGSKIGSIQDVYLDQETGEPEWVAIKTGLFGSKLSFAPLAQARGEGGGVVLPYDKDRVKNAPSVDPDGALSQQEEAELYRYYGLEYAELRSDSGLPEGQGAPAAPAPRAATGDPTPQGGATGNDVSGRETDDAMTRSEEELRIGTTQRETGRVRLRKHIVSDRQQVQVPVSREELRVEREPITDANVGAATSGPELSEEEHEVTLRAEEPVIEKRVVPKERVRLDRDTVTEQRQVTEEVRREQIDLVEGEGAPPQGIDGERGTDEGIR
jgi:uncharacterized protein (TIGR02271 family)